MSEARLFSATTFTEIYERSLVGPLFRPFAEQLFARLAPNPDDSLIDVACGTGVLRIAELQPAGGRPMTVAAFLAGRPLAPGTRLGDAASEPA